MIEYARVCCLFKSIPATENSIASLGPTIVRMTSFLPNPSLLLEDRSALKGLKIVLQLISKLPRAGGCFVTESSVSSHHIFTVSNVL